MITLKETLSKLGETPEEVAEKLRSLRVRGQRHNSCECPIAHYAQSITGRHCVVGSTMATMYAEPGKNEMNEHVELPIGVKQFVNDFDALRYPDLEG